MARSAPLVAGLEPTKLYEVPDDDGFLGLLDPDAYAAFVGRDWALPQLLVHLRMQMHEQLLLLWGTGREGMWRVRDLGESVRRDGSRAFAPVYQGERNAPRHLTGSDRNRGHHSVHRGQPVAA